MDDVNWLDATRLVLPAAGLHTGHQQCGPLRLSRNGEGFWLLGSSTWPGQLTHTLWFVQFALSADAAWSEVVQE